MPVSSVTSPRGSPPFVVVCATTMPRSRTHRPSLKTSSRVAASTSLLKLRGIASARYSVESFVTTSILDAGAEVVVTVPVASSPGGTVFEDRSHGSPARRPTASTTLQPSIGTITTILRTARYNARHTSGGYPHGIRTPPAPVRFRRPRASHRCAYDGDPSRQAPRHVRDESEQGARASSHDPDAID